MALFGTKKQTAKETSGEAGDASVGLAKHSPAPAIEDALLRPRITEKAALGTGDNVYVFNVRANAKKPQIAAAVARMYNVTVIKVNVVSIPTKRVFRRGVRGAKGGGKKAYVFLKKGDKIELM
ncbi:MAG: 50S ribosomal protein L23 [Candidatus Paceibacterota bacterium]